MNIFDQGQKYLARAPSDLERLFGLVLPREGFRACAIQWQPKDSDHSALYSRLVENDGELAAFLTAKGRRANVWHSTGHL